MLATGRVEHILTSKSVAETPESRLIYCTGHIDWISRQVVPRENYGFIAIDADVTTYLKLGMLT